MKLHGNDVKQSNLINKNTANKKMFYIPSSFAYYLQKARGGWEYMAVTLRILTELVTKR